MTMRMKIKTFNNYSIITMHYHKLILNSNEEFSFNDENNKTIKKAENEHV